MILCSSNEPWQQYLKKRYIRALQIRLFHSHDPSFCYHFLFLNEDDQIP